MRSPASANVSPQAIHVAEKFWVGENDRLRFGVALIREKWYGFSREHDFSGSIVFMLDTEGSADRDEASRRLREILALPKNVEKYGAIRWQAPAE